MQGGRDLRGRLDLGTVGKSGRRRKKGVNEVGAAGSDDAVSCRASCREMGARYEETDAGEMTEDEGTGERSVGGMKMSSSSSFSLQGSSLRGRCGTDRTVA